MIAEIAMKTCAAQVKAAENEAYLRLRDSMLKAASSEEAQRVALQTSYAYAYESLPRLLEAYASRYVTAERKPHPDQ